jgi:rhomboid protease GluP
LTNEPWRLVTVANVHGGGSGNWQLLALHLGLNAIALDIAGQLVFRLYGVRRFISWYFIGVIGASLASAIWSGATFSTGASGGVFALFGIALGAEWAHKPLVERGMREALGRVGGLLVINLAIGISAGLFGVPIDNSAHIGGLVTGLILGVLIQPTRVESMRRRWTAAAASWRGGEVLVTLLLSALLLVFFANWFDLALWRDTLPF